MENAADQHVYTTLTTTNTTSPPAYTPPSFNPYPSAGYSPTPYPTPAPGPAPGPTPYPPPPAQYPPPPTGPPPYGQDYGYGQQAAGYPPQPGYGTPQYVAAPPPQQPQQQQQQQVVAVSAGQQPVIVRHVQSYTGHIIFSCLVLWLCNWLFGLIAFILAGWYSVFSGMFERTDYESYKCKMLVKRSAVTAAP